MKRIAVLMFVGLLTAGPAKADTILLEDFEAVFPTWTSGYLGTESNLQNYYTVSSGGVDVSRGNNPDGLWLDDGDGLSGQDFVNIVFNNAFALTLKALSIDVAGYQPGTFDVFDAFGVNLLSDDIPLTFGATSDPGVYGHFAVVSTTGIGGFSFTPTGEGGGIEGNTSIDNVSVTVGTDRTPVPEPSSLVLFGTSSLGGLIMRRRRRRIP